MEVKVKYHLLLCATPSNPKCCELDTGKASWEHLKKILKEYKLDSNSSKKGIVMRSKVDCLRICEKGPILLIWPDGIWYGGVTPERVEDIVKSHIINGEPLTKYIIKRSQLLI